MGLPTAALYAEAGAKVQGADVNPAIVAKVNAGQSPVNEQGLDQLVSRGLKSGKLKAGTSASQAAANSDIIFIVVPTMIDEKQNADYSIVTAACIEIGKTIRRGSLVIMGSTCGPGITEKLAGGKIEEVSGLRAGSDFGLAYSPIRAMGGHALEDVRKYARVVGGINTASLEAASLALSVIVEGPMVRVRNLVTAELSKLFEVIYRDVNIALASEFAEVCEKFGADYLEVREASNSQPHSHLHFAGVGVGGHCLSVYSHLLAAESYPKGAQVPITIDARRLNDLQPHHVKQLIEDGLNACKKSLDGARITVLGIAYRPDVKEVRYSPSLELVKILRVRGGKVTVFDPFYSVAELEDMKLTGKPTLASAVVGSDCVVLTVAHEAIKSVNAADWMRSVAKPGVVVDCTGTLGVQAVEREGLVYRAVGRGLWSR
jgi:UDP-N-acetyl-D-mannosaminuronic acid dehydrogenase